MIMLSIIVLHDLVMMNMIIDDDSNIFVFKTDLNYCTFEIKFHQCTALKFKLRE